MKLSREDAIELLDYPIEHEGKTAKTIVRESLGSRRWFSNQRVVVEWDGRFYEAYFDAPLTENVEGGFWEGQESVEFREVFAKSKTITVYTPA